MTTRPPSSDWQLWLREHGPALLLAARQWVNSAADAEDVVQEAFLRFWRNRHRTTDPLGYVYACARRYALEVMRGNTRRGRREVRTARPEALAAPGLFEPVEQDERRRRIEACLRHLPEPQREVLVMKVWGGLTFPRPAGA